VPRRRPRYLAAKGWVEHPRQVGSWDTATLVRHRHVRVALLDTGLHPDRSPTGRVADGVVDEIEDDPGDLGRIEVDLGRALRPALDRDPFGLSRGPGRGHGVGDEVAQRRPFHAQS